MIIESLCLPYFSDGLVYIWVYDCARLRNKKIVCREEDFEDLTTEGGRFYQFYTYRVKQLLNND